MTTDRSKKGYAFQQLSYDTIGACIDVQRQLDLHCMEVDYQRALELALPKQGLEFQREVEIPMRQPFVPRAQPSTLGPFHKPSTLGPFRGPNATIIYALGHVLGFW